MLISEPIVEPVVRVGTAASFYLNSLIVSVVIVGAESAA